MILSIACILVLALVTYWWGNQGVFDAFVHLLCVIVSGALALAVWEPLCLTIFGSPAMAEFGWGLTLGIAFLVLLFATRLTTDKLCPVRPKVARWADWVFGAPMGLAAGALTLGLTLIAAGHVACARELAGFEGWKREPGHAEPRQTDPSNPAAICVGVTEGFFNMLSRNAFTPLTGDHALALLRPAMGQDGASLLRDSVDAGKGRLAVTADGVTVSDFYFDPAYSLASKGQGGFAVLLSAKSPSFENMGGFCMSASQARLINGSTGASAFPAEWSQREEKSGQSLVRHPFDGDGAYVTTGSANGESPVCLIFPATVGDPKSDFYLQIKGLRFKLNKAKQDGKAMAQAVLNGGQAFAPPKGIEDAPKASASDLYAADLLPDGIHLGEENDHGTLLLDGKNLRFSNGDAKGGGATLAVTDARRGAVCQFEQSPAARTVILRCSNGSTVEIFDNDPRRRVDAMAQPVLLDTTMGVFEPRGYIMRGDKTYEIMMEEKEKFPFVMGNFRRAGKSGEIWVIYRVPEGTTLQAVVARNPQGDFSSAVPLAKTDLKVVAAPKP